jgi:hypothetical protein
MTETGAEGCCNIAKSRNTKQSRKIVERRAVGELVKVKIIVKYQVSQRIGALTEGNRLCRLAADSKMMK